jgi:hypothetical protein
MIVVCKLVAFERITTTLGSCGAVTRPSQRPADSLFGCPLEGQFTTAQTIGTSTSFAISTGWPMAL